MDLNFFRRAEQRFASRTAAPLDFGLLVAMLQTRQVGERRRRGPRLCGARPRGLRILWSNCCSAVRCGGGRWRCRRAASIRHMPFNTA